MKPSEILRGDTSARIGYFCGECGQVWLSGSDDVNRENAEQCCACEGCGQSTYRGYGRANRCDPCYKIWEKEASKRPFDKAKKINGCDYDGPVFSPGGRYFGSWYEYVEDYWDTAEEDAPLPPPASACDVRRFELDIERSLEGELENNHSREDDDSVADQLVDVAELREFIKQWNAKQTLESWWEAHGTYVVATAADKRPE